MSPQYHTLLDVIGDELFPEVDLLLRRGRHVGAEDDDQYRFLQDALDHLEPFYRRYGAELVHKSDGYFFLLPSGDRLGRGHLGVGEMLVGQALALARLNPATTEASGVVDKAEILQVLSRLVGNDVLVRAFNRGRLKRDERVAAETIRRGQSAALRHLADLGFVDIVDEDHVRLRQALMRFADPVRSLPGPANALERLIASGEVEAQRPVEDDEDEEDP